MRIGALALQGGWAAHLAAVRALGHTGVPVRTADELAACDGLILPGGESTTHLRLIERFALREALDAFMATDRPVLATCAGLILSAREVLGPSQPSFGWLDVTVTRNAWGRQVHSFEAVADGTDLALMFIRAPRITRVGPGVEITHTFEGEPVAVRQGRFFGMAFHPELTGDRRLHAAAFPV